MKKIITIGDVHGLSFWKEFIFGTNYEKWRATIDHGAAEDLSLIKFDKIIFIGDYFDSFTVGNAEMKQNIMDIIHLKRALGDKVVLLLGNHDLHYIDRDYRCSGFRPEMWYDFNDIMREHKDLFEAAYQYRDILWSHAGLTSGSWDHYSKHLEKERIEYSDYADALNTLYKMNFGPLFAAGYGRGGGHKNPGIFWADRRELINDPAPISQIVGHTPVGDIETHVVGTHKVEHNQVVTHLAFIDCCERGSRIPYVIEFNSHQNRPLKKMRYDK
jgi:hypothetical protein